MSTFHWVLVVVGLFLVVYAALVLLKRGGGRRRESLGCGFVLLAGLVWGFALANYLGSWWAGMRLGLAAALVLPALVTLTHPTRGRLWASVVLLTFAVILGASVVPRLWEKVRPEKQFAAVRQAEEAVAKLRSDIQKTEDHIRTLDADREALASDIQSAGYADFEAIADDSEGYALLKELADVDRLRTEANERLERLGATLEQMESALRRVRRIAGSAAQDAEQQMAAALDEARQGLQATRPVTVEEHVERKNLRDLFENGL